MRYAAAVCLAISLTFPTAISAQTIVPAPSAPVTTGATEPARTTTNFWAPFTQIPDDLVRFLSADTLKVTFDGDAELLLGQDTERLKGKLTLGANGWGIFNESGDNPLHIEFKRRAKKPSN